MMRKVAGLALLIAGGLFFSTPAEAFCVINEGSVPIDIKAGGNPPTYYRPALMPGEAALTAPVDFPALAEAARPAGVRISDLATQGDWLRRLGIDARLKTLTAASPERADEQVAHLGHMPPLTGL